MTAILQTQQEIKFVSGNVFNKVDHHVQTSALMCSLIRQPMLALSHVTQIPSQLYIIYTTDLQIAHKLEKERYTERTITQKSANQHSEYIILNGNVVNFIVHHLMKNLHVVIVSIIYDKMETLNQSVSDTYNNFSMPRNFSVLSQTQDLNQCQDSILPIQS